MNDSATGEIWVWDVSLGYAHDGRRFADAKAPGAEGVVDGLKCDAEGRVYCTAPGKTVAIFSAGGREVGRLVFPEQPSAVAWGGDDYQTLYVTAETSVYRARMQAPGVGSGVKGLPRARRTPAA